MMLARRVEARGRPLACGFPRIVRELEVSGQTVAAHCTAIFLTINAPFISIDISKKL
jgi:hypothetical protein